jgi:DNA-binding IclR family transcriptional regulator
MMWNSWKGARAIVASEPDGRPGSQAVDRAALLVATVVESARPRTFSSLSGELGLAKSTTSRLLQALERGRLLQRDGSGAYRPGPLFAFYAGRPGVGPDLVELAQPTLERVARRCDETVNLAVPRHGVIPLAQVDSPHLLGATSWVGVDVPPHCSALGKVFYAFGALPLPTGRLGGVTDHSVTSLTELKRELRAVTRRGWAVAWEELEPGLVAVAAPVRGADGAVLAAVSVSGPTARITRARVTELGELLVAETAELSARLGHQVTKEVVA